MYRAATRTLTRQIHYSRRVLSGSSIPNTAVYAGQSMSDPARPDLFYHLFTPPTPASKVHPSFALSFLDSVPPSADTETIVGWLPAASSAKESVGLHDFVENPKFRTVLHEAVQAGLREEVDDIQTNGAIMLQDGWMHIHDDRNVPMPSRIGDPDDILATVLVQESKIIPETYQPMPSYRICTSDGLTQLTPGLAKKLREILEERAKT